MGTVNLLISLFWVEKFETLGGGQSPYFGTEILKINLKNSEKSIKKLEKSEKSLTEYLFV